MAVIIQKRLSCAQTQDSKFSSHFVDSFSKFPKKTTLKMDIHATIKPSTTFTKFQIVFSMKFSKPDLVEEHYSINLPCFAKLGRKNRKGLYRCYYFRVFHRGNEGKAIRHGC